MFKLKLFYLFNFFILRNSSNERLKFKVLLNKVSNEHRALLSVQR